ncbi:hypothetical protein D7V67_15595 [Clostridium paraputrificum]|uniref:hypothetical protein n=1 Tax=Clostridium paraputrificum TaxID=29363 RepID=UPI000EA3A26A|nr:hypothetical protein [Clostridium paraputrificum]RKI45785.1 hypothetical protein D7V67_15595 [Clostridium paraputrificum]
MGYTHGIKWSHKDMVSEVYKVMDSLNIKRMPTKSECDLVTGDYGLSNVIRRRGGFNWLAHHLGLDQKDSETKFGLSGELKIKELLENKGYKVEKMSVKHPYDLLVNENIKIDVKTANKYTSPKGLSSYSFNLEKKNPTCDIYVFICKDDNKILVIPSKFLRQTQLCITDKKSKYDGFKDKWEYVEVYNKFYKWLS